MNPIRRLGFLVLVLTGIGAAFASVDLAFAQSQQPAPAGVRTAKKPLAASPRNEVALAAVGGKLYVVGGGIAGIAGNAVPMIDRYDPATDTWQSRAPMPKGLDHLGIVVLDGKIVTIGGFIGSVHRRRGQRGAPVRPSGRRLACARAPEAARIRIFDSARRLGGTAVA